MSLVGRLREYRLTDAISAEQMKETCECLVGVLLHETRYRQAGVVLDAAAQRFPRVEWTDPEILGFLDDVWRDRTQTRQRIVKEMIKATREVQALQWCRLLDALWTPGEAIDQWRTVIQETPAGSLAEQCARVSLTKALLRMGQIAEADAAVQGLPESVSSFARAQGLTLLARIACARNQEEESMHLYVKAAQIDRSTSLPEWCKAWTPTSLVEAGSSVGGGSSHRLVLEAYQDLMDGDYAAAIDKLAPAVTDLHGLDALPRALPCMIMLAHVGVEDYVEAEAWGYQALRQYHEDHPEDDRIAGLFAEIQSLDTTVLRLTAAARGQATAEGSDASSMLEFSIQVCQACTNMELRELPTEAMARGVQQLYVEVCKHRYARLLTAEYRYLCQASHANDAPKSFARCEPLLFAGLLLMGESLDRIRASLTWGVGDTGIQDRIRRFAVFAMKVKRLDLVAAVMETDEGCDSSAGDVEILEELGDEYLAASNPRKAANAYLKAAVANQDPNESQAIRLKIIDVYANVLKDYDEAIRQCEDVIQRYPGSSLASQLEFRVGRLAYLRKDYSNAASQLIAFRKKYPEHPQTNQAILLTGLSRMAEGNTRDAIGHFTEIIRLQPDGELAAQSKFLIGYAQMSDQQYSAATETFRQLVEQFPNSPYVEKARNLLDRLNRVSR